MSSRVLFLCTGNICRSPLAEVAARSVTGDAHLVFSSAGTHAMVGHHATDAIRHVAADLGLDLSDHRATPLLEVEQPDLVFGMEQHHLVAARSRFPELDVARIRLLDHPNAVADPYGLDLDAYGETADRVMQALQAIDFDTFR